MSKKKWILGAVIVGYMGFKMLQFADGANIQPASQNTTNTHQTQIITAKKGYVLSDKQNKIIEDLVKYNRLDFINGDLVYGNIPFKSLIITTGNQASSDYEENQVNADNKYYEKTVYISGKITGILSGIGNQPYITLYSDNNFSSPQLHFDDQYKNQIALLRKGKKIAAVCKGSGAIAGTPMFNDCIFADQYYPIWKNQIMSDTHDYFMGKDKEYFTDDTRMILFFFSFTAKLIPDNSVLFSNDFLLKPERFDKDKKKMNEEFDKYSSSHTREKSDNNKKFLEYAGELKMAGVNIDFLIKKLANNINQNKIK